MIRKLKGWLTYLLAKLIGRERDPNDTDGDGQFG